MAGNIPVDTPLSDRELLIHMLAHVEEIGDTVAELRGTLETYRPLLARLFPGGRAADAVSVMQAAREARRGRRRT